MVTAEDTAVHFEYIAEEAMLPAFATRSVQQTSWRPEECL